MNGELIKQIMEDMLAEIASIEFTSLDFVVIYLGITPLMTIGISAQVFVYYHTMMIEKTSAEFRQNLFTSLIIIFDIYIAINIIIAYNIYSEYILRKTRRLLLLL